MTQVMQAASVGDLGGLLPSWSRHLQAERKSPRTIQSYGEAATQLISFLTTAGMPTSVDAIRREHVEAFLVDVLERRSASTAANRFRSLQQLFRWLVDEGEVTASPMAKMKPPAVPEQPVPVVTEHDVSALLAACSGKSFDDRRDRAIIRLLLDTGLRLSEIAGLKWHPFDRELSDVDLDSRELLVLGKGGRQRRAWIGVNATKDLDRYIRARAGHRSSATNALWLGRRGPMGASGIAQMLERRSAEAGIAKVHPHQLRHTFAHVMKLQGASDEDVMRLGGWRSADVMRRYAASAGEDRARLTHQRLSPGDRL